MNDGRINRRTAESQKKQTENNQNHPSCRSEKSQSLWNQERNKKQKQGKKQDEKSCLNQFFILQSYGENPRQETAESDAEIKEGNKGCGKLRIDF